MVRKNKKDIPVKTQVAIVSGSVVLLVVFSLFIAWADASTNFRFFNSVPTFSDVTIKGEPVCLPQRSSQNNQIKDCIQGIKTTSGAYYGVAGAFDRDDDKNHTEVTGVLSIPVGLSEYVVSGVITVK